MGKNCEGNGEGKIFRKRLLKLTTEIKLVENLWFFGSLKAYVWCVRKDNWGWNDPGFQLSDLVDTLMMSLSAYQLSD